MASILDDSAILNTEDIDFSQLFSSGNEETEEEPKKQEDTPETKENKENKENKDTPAEEAVDPDELFGEDQQPESVGKEGPDKGEAQPSSKSSGNAPKSNVISSFAQAMKDDGYLQNLDEDTVKGITDAQSFAEALDKEVYARLDAQQKRVAEALDMNIAPDTVKYYETILGNLNKVSASQLEEEGEEAENARRQLIYQDYLNKGFKADRAQKETKKSFDAGTDIDDAKEALESNISYYQSAYDKLLDDAKSKQDAERAQIQKEADELRQSLLDDKEVFKGITLDQQTRRKAYEAITKPVMKDENGYEYTTIQKYAEENPVEFRKYLSVLFTLTNGFTSLDGLLKKEINKKVKSHLNAFESKLVGQSSGGGSLSYAEDMGDGQAELAKLKHGWKIDI